MGRGSKTQAHFEKLDAFDYIFPLVHNISDLVTHDTQHIDFLVTIRSFFT
jgi:hypothetical protein